MRHYIFILTMLLNAIAIHAQEKMNIPQLMEYLERNHPEGFSKTMNSNSLGGTIINMDWEEHYNILNNKKIERYRMQILKDSIIQTFLDASDDAAECYHLKRSNGSEDSIRYAIVLQQYPDKKAQLNISQHDNYLAFHLAKEAASFQYFPKNTKSCILANYYNTIAKEGHRGILDFKAIHSIITDIAQENNAEIFPIKYQRDAPKDSVTKFLLNLMGEIDKSGNLKDLQTNQFTSILNDFNGTFYIFSPEKANVVFTTFRAQLEKFLDNNHDKEFTYYTRLSDAIIELDGQSRTSQQIYTQKDELGRYIILVANNQDSDFLSENDSLLLSDIVSYKSIEEGLQYRTLNILDFDLWETFSRYLGLDISLPQRREIIGGNTFQETLTFQWELNRDSVNNIRKKLINNHFCDFQYIEKHTTEADTILLTAKGRIHEKLICKIYGKGDTYTGVLQQIVTFNTGKIAEPFQTQWIQDFISQMKDSAYIEEHDVHYKYGNHSDPSSVGEVIGKLYVQEKEESLGLGFNFVYVWAEEFMYNHPQQTFNFIENYHKGIHFIHITDHILVHYDDIHREFQLLYIDHVNGKYLIPEEWYNITDYKYGKKKYLKKRKK